MKDLPTRVLLPAMKIQSGPLSLSSYSVCSFDFYERTIEIKCLLQNSILVVFVTSTVYYVLKMYILVVHSITYIRTDRTRKLRHLNKYIIVTELKRLYMWGETEGWMMR